MLLLSMRKKGCVCVCEGGTMCIDLYAPALMPSFTACLSKKLQTHIFGLPRLPGLCLTTVRMLGVIKDEQEGKHTPETGWGQNQNLSFCHIYCGFNVSFMQMHISWQCWDWPGIQTMICLR